MSAHLRLQIFIVLIVLVLQQGAFSKPLVAGQAPDSAAVEVKVKWDKVVTVSKTTPTLQVVVNPPLRRGTKIHDRAFQALHDLGADYVRYVPWLPYPKLGVAELEPPKDGKTSWDFSLLDPMMEDVMNATEGHSVVVNFSTIPQWMFKTDAPVPYPADPDQVTWGYEKGTELRDPSLKELADYYARLVSWYTQGGFSDEYGRRHESGHHYAIPYWEVLNEPEFEHSTTPQQYTARYDAIVRAIQKVAPHTQFMGMVLAGPSPNVGTELNTPQYFEYFLDHKNHHAGVPLDMISYHAYAMTAPDQDLAAAPFTFFEQADQFVREVRYIEAIRKRLSPETRTSLDELGSILPSDFADMKPGSVFKPISPAYWNLSGALYAYLFAHLAHLGIDVVGESQFVGYPTQFPSVSLVDWDTGQPNARFWVLKLLHDNFRPGDKMVSTSLDSPFLYAQAFVTAQGKHKILLVNKRDRPFEIVLPGAEGAQAQLVDQTTSFQPPASSTLTGNRITLGGFAVAVVTLEK